MMPRGASIRLIGLQMPKDARPSDGCTPDHCHVEVFTIFFFLIFTSKNYNCRALSRARDCRLYRPSRAQLRAPDNSLNITIKWYRGISGVELLQPDGRNLKDT